MRNVILCAALLATAAAAGCSTRTASDTVQIAPNSMSYAQAHQRCWQDGVGMPTSATGASTTRTQAYENCLQSRGWADAYAAWTTK